MTVYVATSLPLPGVIDTNWNRNVTDPGSINNITINGNATLQKNFTVDGITDMDTRRLLCQLVIAATPALWTLRPRLGVYRRQSSPYWRESRASLEFV